MEAIEVVRFTDQYEPAAVVYGTSAAALRERDERQDQPLQRWLAVQGAQVVAAVSTWSRPDLRTFLNFAGHRAAYPRLTEAVVEELRKPVHTSAAADDAELARLLRSAGLDIELVEERFRIRFDEALARLRRAWAPPGLSIHPADSVDEEKLFNLDNRLRQDTPGTDGWRGNREWFHAELSESPPFDPSAYLVALDERDGGYVGLVRLWRNPTGPRLGLIGVVPEYRHTTIAAALLERVLRRASQWGHNTFTVDTSPSNRVIYKRMGLLGAKSLGQSYQLVRNAPHGRAAEPGSAGAADDAPEQPR